MATVPSMGQQQDVRSEPGPSGGRGADTVPLSETMKITRRRLRRVRWGNLRRRDPFCDAYGFSRGTPVDRFYVEDFLARNAEAIRGDVLEVQDDAYTRKFGAPSAVSHVLDIDRSNQRATLFADLTVASSLPESSYDCVILTQTLGLISDPVTALRNVAQSLRPGGTLLVTVSVTSRIQPSPARDRWRFTPDGLSDLLTEAIGEQAAIDLGWDGNLTATIAFLAGLAHEELRRDDLVHRDARFPLIAHARVTRAGS